MVGCVQTVLRNNSFLIQSDDGQIKDMSTCLLTLISSEEKVGKDIILEPPKYEGGLLTVGGDPVVEEGGIYEEGVYFSVLYSFVYYKE